MPFPNYSDPMAPSYSRGAYPADAAHSLEDRSLPRDAASSTPTQPHLSHAMNVYSSLPISAERTLEYAPFPQDLPSFPSANGKPAEDLPNIEHVGSDSQSKEDHPLPVDAARWISMSPTQFDREYPGGNPFVIEELSLDSEEDPESASYVELGTSALNRIFIIFWAVEYALFVGDDTDMYRDIIWGVLADLLKDGKIWLWVDSDEEKWADLRPATTWRTDLHWKASRAYVHQKLSCSSLRLRKPQLPTWSSFRERVSKTSFAMRVSAVTWATFTSVSVREAGWVRGRADWTRCAFLRTAAWTWHYYVLQRLGVVDLIEDDGRHSHYEIVFKHTLRRDALRCHGHSCYYPANYLGESLQRWLFFQPLLCSESSGKDVSMILYVSSDQECACQQCAKLKTLYLANNDDRRYVPPPSLIILEELRQSLAIDTPTWLRFLGFSVSYGIISDSILTKMHHQIRKCLIIGNFDFKYQPWVNRLPSSLRRSVVTCSESEWREAEHAVRRENQDTSVLIFQWDSTDVGIGVWITAVYLLMAEFSFQKLTPWKYRRDCYLRCSWHEVLDKPVYPPHISARVEAFCDATSESSDVPTHTCCEFRWDRHPLKLRQCYAAAYLILHPECQIVPLVEPLSCPVLPAKCNSYCGEDCFRKCIKCQGLSEGEPPAPLHEVIDLPMPNGSLAHEQSLPDADGLHLNNPTSEEIENIGNDMLSVELDDTNDIVPTAAIVPTVSAITQIPAESGRPREPALSKAVILPELKDYFLKLLARCNIPMEYTNLGEPQLPWCTLPRMLKNRHLEIAGWPEDLPLPDATGKHNAKGIMGLTAKEARLLYKALPDISFRPMDKARARPREEESEDVTGNRPTKKVKGMGKAPAEGEKKFRLSEVQTVVSGIRVGKSN